MHLIEEFPSALGQAAACGKLPARQAESFEEAGGRNAAAARSGPPLEMVPEVPSPARASNY